MAVRILLDPSQDTGLADLAIPEPRQAEKTELHVSHPSQFKQHRLQVAALCWRWNAKGRLRILLITSRETRRWVIPKGWPMKNRTHAGAAAREAFEEAGVKGEICDKSLGLYTYEKNIGRGKSVFCAVQVFPLNVETLLKQYPENGQRNSKWFSRKKAMRNVQEPELQEIIRAFDPKKL